MRSTKPREMRDVGGERTTARLARRQLLNGPLAGDEDGRVATAGALMLVGVIFIGVRCNVTDSRVSMFARRTGLTRSGTTRSMRLPSWRSAAPAGRADAAGWPASPSVSAFTDFADRGHRGGPLELTLDLASVIPDAMAGFINKHLRSR